MALMKIGIIAGYKAIKQENGSFKNQVRFEDGDTVYGITESLGEVGAEGSIEVETLSFKDNDRVLLMAKGHGAVSFADAQKNAEPQSVVDERRASYAAKKAAEKAAEKSAELAVGGGNGALGD
jgi:hypothetical protein